MRGGEFSIANIISYMAEEMGDDIYLFQQLKGEAPHPNIKIYHKRDVKFISYVMPYDVDIVLTWGSGLHIANALYNERKVPYIYNMRFWRDLFDDTMWHKYWIKKKIIDQPPGKKKEYLFKEASNIIVNSQYVQKVFKKFYNLNSYIVNPPVNPENIIPSLYEKKYITVVGDIPQSGHMLLYRLARLMPEENFWSIGINTAQDKIPSNVRVEKSFLQNRKDLYKYTKLMLCPRQYDETFGRVVLESMYNSTPVITSNSGSMGEITGNDLLCINNFNNNEKEWCSRIKEVLDDYDDIGEQLRIRASFEYDYKTICHSFRNTIKKTVDEVVDKQRHRFFVGTSFKSSVDISSVIFTYKRPEYLEEQVKAIRSQSVDTSEVIIGHLVNERTKDFDFSLGDKVIKFDYDPGFYAKFIVATAAQGRFVGIFDDDTIPGNKWYENCLNCYAKQKGIYGTFGMRLNGPSYNHHGNPRVGGWYSQSDYVVPVDSVGHCWFLPYHFLQYLFIEHPPFYNNAEDLFFSYVVQKYGKKGCFTPPHPKGDKSLWGSIKGEYGLDNKAISIRSIEEHRKLRDEMVKILIDRGWVPLFMRGEKCQD